MPKPEVDVGVVTFTPLKQPYIDLPFSMVEKVQDSEFEQASEFILRHIGLLEADVDKIRKIRPKGTHVRMLYVPREVDLADGRGERSDPSLSARSTSLGTYSILT